MNIEIILMMLWFCSFILMIVCFLRGEIKPGFTLLVVSSIIALIGRVLYG